jgi:hypothetical protein
MNTIRHEGPEGEERKASRIGHTPSPMVVKGDEIAEEGPTPSKNPPPENKPPLLNHQGFEQLVTNHQPDKPLTEKDLRVDTPPKERGKYIWLSGISSYVDEQVTNDPQAKVERKDKGATVHTTNQNKRRYTKNEKRLKALGLSLNMLKQIAYSPLNMFEEKLASLYLEGKLTVEGIDEVKRIRRCERSRSYAKIYRERKRRVIALLEGSAAVAQNEEHRPSKQAKQTAQRS